MWLGTACSFTNDSGDSNLCASDEFVCSGDSVLIMIVTLL